jgi:intracellular septation protein
MTIKTTAEGAPKVNPVLKLALELGPLVLFFLTNARSNLFTATAVFMVATFVALIASWLLMKRLAIMPLVTGVVVLVFGGLTLWLGDTTFIKVKPTIVNTLFGLVLLGGLVFGKSLLAVVLDAAFELTDEGWRKLTLRWGVFFLFLAAVNEVVWRNFSDDIWVDFKVWGIMPITMIFAMCQVPLMQRYEKGKDSEEAEAPAEAG